MAKFLLFIKNCIREQKDKQIVVLYLLSILFYSYLIFKDCVTDYYDTRSYIEAYETIIGGHLDLFRTPVYPLFIGFIREIFGNHYYIAIATVQYIVMMWSFYFFYKLSKLLIHNNIIVFCISVVYVASPYVAGLSFYILTESLSVSGFTYLIYLLYRIYSEERISNAPLVYVSMTLTLLFLLRPQFLYILPPLAIYFIGVYVKRRKLVARFSVAIFVPCVVLIGYSGCIYAKCGIFTTSTVGLLNQQVMVDVMVENGYNIDKKYYIEPRPIAEYYEEVENTNIYSKIDWRWDNLTNEFSIKEIKDFTAKTISLNFSEYLKYKIRCAKDSLLYDFIGPKELYVLECIKFYFPIFKICTLLLSLCIYSIYICFLTIRYRYIPWISIVIALSIMSNYVVSILGAQGEWARLCAPSLPLFLIIVGEMLDTLKFEAKKIY